MTRSPCPATWPVAFVGAQRIRRRSGEGPRWPNQMLLACGLVEGIRSDPRGQAFPTILAKEMSMAGHDFFQPRLRMTGFEATLKGLSRRACRLRSRYAVRELASGILMKWAIPRGKGGRIFSSPGVAVIRCKVSFGGRKLLGFPSLSFGFPCSRVGKISPGAGKHFPARFTGVDSPAPRSTATAPVKAPSPSRAPKPPAPARPGPPPALAAPQICEATLSVVLSD